MAYIKVTYIKNDVITFINNMCRIAMLFWNLFMIQASYDYLYSMLMVKLAHDLEVVHDGIHVVHVGRDLWEGPRDANDVTFEWAAVWVKF